MPILRNPVRDRYTVVSNKILNDTRLSWDAKGVMAYLLSKPDDWIVRASEVARTGGCGRDKVLRIFRELREAGYIKSTYPRGDDGTVHGEVIEINDGEPEVEETGSRISRTPEKPDSGFSVDILSTDSLPSTEKETNTDNCPKRTYPSGFMTFWEAYPKKVGKGAAESAWKRARINGHLSELLDSLDKQKASDQWAKDGGQYIPNPATWINQRRWEDEVQKPQSVETMYARFLAEP